MTGTQYSCLFWSKVNNYQSNKIKMEKCSSRCIRSDKFEESATTFVEEMGLECNVSISG